MEKNQAAIDAGRYEVENRRFYHPDDLHQEYGQPLHAESGYQAPQGVPTPQQQSVQSGSRVSDMVERAPGRLANWVNKATGRPPSRVEEEVVETQPPRARAKLKKRNSSSSGLSVVRE